MMSLFFSEGTVMQQPLIFRKRTRRTHDTLWFPWTGDLHRPSTAVATKVYYQFDDGGQLVIYLNLLSTIRQEQISKELLTSNGFRQYRVQDNNEPRLHFLLHINGAIDDLAFDKPQPGYKYGSVQMKARAFGASFPQVCRLSGTMQRICQANLVAADGTGNCESTGVFWNIGADCIIYRNGKDQINFHADDDQGEQLILTVLVSTPLECTRKVLIRNKNGLEEFELFLGAGDAYSMDGTMQQKYVHAVPRNGKCSGSNAAGTKSQQRIVIVFRRGNQVIRTKDSGRSVPNLFPPVILPYQYGELNGLSEGSLYSRTGLRNLHAHR